MNKKRVFPYFVAVLAFLAVTGLTSAAEDVSGTRRLLVFGTATCHRCQQAKQELIPQIEKEFSGRIRVEYRDIGDLQNYKLLLSLREKHGLKSEEVPPVFYFEGKFLKWDKDIKENLKALLSQPITAGVALNELPRVDLVSRFRDLKLFTVFSAGLVDGINPCAFTVIIFFISFLALQGYKKAELAVIGLSFIFAVFATYFFIGLGLFNFLYRLKNFWIISRIVNLSIGIFSIILGILSLYDFLKIIKQGRAEGLALQLPNAVKGRIHAVIGWHFRKPRNAQEKPVKVHILRLVITSLATGFLVSILEAICTGQVYLPTIIFVLKTTPLKLPALGYLLFYNLLFIAPLFIIFVFALLGVTSEQFARLLKKHLLSVKLLLALVFFLLGFVLIHTQIPRSPLAEGYQEDSLVWDAGRAQEGAVLEHSFALKNASRNLWHIKNINTSCGCTTSEVKKKILLPGEATSINVRFNTQGYSGHIQQYVYVYVDILDAAAASKVKIEDVPPIDNQIIRFIIKAYLAK